MMPKLVRVLNFKELVFDMKTLLQIVFLLITTMLLRSEAKSQTYVDVYVGAAHFRGLDNINKALYKYNYTRPWLTDKMEGVNRTAFTGWEVYIGNPEIFQEFGFSSFSKTVEASGPQPDFNNEMSYRKVKVASYSLYYGFIGRILEEEKIEVLFSVGLSWEIGRVGMFYAENIDYKEPEIEVVSKSNLGFKLTTVLKYYPLDWFEFNIKPTYSFAGKVDMSDVSGRLQYTTGVHPAGLYDKFSRMSISLGISISPGRY